MTFHNKYDTNSVLGYFFPVIIYLNAGFEIYILNKFQYSY